MVDRILIDDDTSPINGEIILDPQMIEQNHARLIENLVYELMATYLFHEFDNKLSKVDDEVYDLLNPSHYKKLDTTESEIEVSEFEPAYDSDDFKEYINHFLQTIERQHLLKLYSDLINRQLFSAKALFSPELENNLRNFRVADLLNNGRYNKALKYDLESIEGTESSFIDMFLNSKPIVYDTLKNYIKFTKTDVSFITANTNNYMLDIFKKQRLVPQDSDSLENLKVGKIKQSNKTINLGKAKQPIQKLKVKQDRVIFEGMFLNKEIVMADENTFYTEVFLAMDEIETKINNLDAQKLDIIGSSLNPISSAIAGALTPKRGKLGVGEIHIKLSMRERVKGKKERVARMTTILERMGLNQERLESKDPENVEVFEHESPKEKKDRAKLEAETSDEDLEDAPTPPPDIFSPHDRFIPIVVISTVTLINEWEIDFSTTKGTFLDSRREGSGLSGKGEKEERRETSKDKSITLSDVSTMGRLKSSYRALERMVDRFD